MAHTAWGDKGPCIVTNEYTAYPALGSSKAVSSLEPREGEVHPDIPFSHCGHD